MKKEVAELWVKALRSGKYKQGKRVLQGNDGNYCCLGVLCEIAPQELVPRDSLGRLPGVSLSDAFLEEGSRYSYSDLKAWAGLGENDGQISESLRPPRTTGSFRDNRCQYLTQLNDHEGWTFDQIADFIEKNSEHIS